MLQLDHYTEIADRNFSFTINATNTFIHIYGGKQHTERLMHVLTVMLFFKNVVIY